jgi:hypothetical protein
MNYNQISSEYIKKMFQQTSWQNHEKIDDLIKLHGYILNPPRSCNSGMHFNHLSSKYRDEYLNLLREHSPEALEKVLSDEQARSEYRIKKQAENDALEEQAKKSWLLAGGCL